MGSLLSEQKVVVQLRGLAVMLELESPVVEFGASGKYLDDEAGAST